MEISLSLSLTGRLLSSAFSPALLFALAEPGVWLDPSDVANLNWRRNLLTWTEQFDNAAWTKVATTVTTNAAVAPDGTTTADALTPTSTGFLAVQVYNLAGTYSASVSVKDNGAGSCAVAMGTGTIGYLINLNLSTGAFISGRSYGGGTLVGYTIVSQGNGWWRVTVSATAAAGGVAVFNADGTSPTQGILAWGAQLELGSTATEYQRISDVNTEVIERFPSATLYQDTAGTQPVTTPGQTVALALDKSKGLVLGSELVTNGDFATDTGWTKGAGVTISGGKANFSAASGYVLYRASVSGISVGSFYEVTFTVSDYVSGSIRPYLGATPTFGASVSANGTYTARFGPTAGAEIGFNSASAFTGSIDNFSIKAVTGFHATQATAASRPTYGIVPRTGRRNLLTRTEEFNDAAWTKTAVTVSANVAVAPDGTTTAEKVTVDTANSFHRLAAPTQNLSATSHTLSVYMKAAEYTSGGLSLFDGSVFTGRATFDLSAGTVAITNGTATITSVGNGWYRCTVTGNGAATTSAFISVNSVFTFTGDGTSGILIWGAQLETGSTATAYQRVGSAFDVTEAGVASLSYLSFDGVDDFLVTPTITPGIDKAQIFAGVRKLSDTAGVVAETSTNAGGAPGAFYLVAGEDVSARYSFLSRGSVGGSGNIAKITTGFAPDQAVLTATGDISADLNTMRRNGAAGTSGTADQGTGNYLAYPLYIGRRGGTTLPFNGQLYSLIVRFGTNLDAGTITSTETWVNGRTGAF